MRRAVNNLRPVIMLLLMSRDNSYFTVRQLGAFIHDKGKLFTMHVHWGMANVGKIEIRVLF
jgi:hypothetical protein